MKKIIIIASLLLASFVNANPIDDKCSQHVIYGAPISAIPDNEGQYLCRLGYAARYSYATRVSEYVVEKVTSKSIVGNAARKDEFREDPEVPVQYRATLKDYQGSGYDRGHMAPAADFYYSVQAMSESFFLTNMMPQIPGNNRGIWKYTEEYTREWAKAFGEIYVVTGVIYTDPIKEFGPNKVKVPGYLYKIVVAPGQNKSIAFLYPNQKLPVEDMPKYIVTISDIEQYTGINFMPNLPAELKAIETTKANWNEWSGK